MRKKFRSIFPFSNSSKKTIVLILVVSFLSISVTTVASIMLSRIGNLTIPSLGNIKTVGVEAYWDPSCENRTENIEWGIIWPGTSKNVKLYLKSASNVQTVLNLNATDLNPIEISDSIKLSWDYDGSLLSPNETIEVTLSLYFSADDAFIKYLVAEQVQHFSFDIFISANA